MKNRVVWPGPYNSYNFCNCGMLQIHKVEVDCASTIRLFLNILHTGVSDFVTMMPFYISNWFYCKRGLMFLEKFRDHKVNQKIRILQPKPKLISLLNVQ